MATNTINSLNLGGNTGVFSLPYGVCSTAAATAAKTVTIDNFSLEAGAAIIVKFTYANTAETAPTLNVNSTGAIPLCRYGTTALSTGTTTTGWYAGSVQLLVYDGTSWIRDYWNNTTYSNASLGNGYATCSTAADTATKTASLSSYSLSTGGMVSVRFTNGNTAKSPTLNIASKGAKAIYFNNAALTDTTLIKAGDVVTMVYSTYYHIVAINGAVVTPGSYGPSADATPAHGGTFSVPYITVDATGRVTGASTKTITLPAAGTSYTHPTHTAATGVPTANQTPAFGGTFSVNQIINDNLGHVTANTSRTITIPSTLSNGTSTAGLIKTTSTVTSSSGYTACPVISGVPYYKDTNTQAVSSVNGKTGTVTLSAADVGAVDSSHTTSHAPSNAQKNSDITKAEIEAKLTGAITSHTHDYAASSHNQASSTINAMTGYSKPSSTSAIATTDSLNAAIGKLEKALDGKANAHDHPYAPSSHVGDSTHATSTEKANWNAAYNHSVATHARTDATKPGPRPIWRRVWVRISKNCQGLQQ